MSMESETFTTAQNKRPIGVDTESEDEYRRLFRFLSAQNVDIQKLKDKLTDGSLEVQPLSHKFWNTLHADCGSSFGYLFGFLLILYMSNRWIMEQLTDGSDGHYISKALILLFLFYSYSFISFGLEAALSAILFFEIYRPKFLERIVNVLHRFISWSKVTTFRYSYTVFSIVWCMITAATGANLWDRFWWNHICKSYHDRTCRRSWIGKFVISYRHEVCFDQEESISSVICEKLVSYAPILILTVTCVLVGNIMLPLINDYFCKFCNPFCSNLESINAIMDKLEEYEEIHEDETGTFDFDSDDIKTCSIDVVESEEVSCSEEKICADLLT